MDIPCIGGPLHGQSFPMGTADTLIHRTTGSGGTIDHRYLRELYVNAHRQAYLWVHPEATDAQLDHALGLADI